MITPTNHLTLNSKSSNVSPQ
uniref:Uncharacterized protein n=1 Tax=Arundo donax TaxID=35708 RepID=A0A0A8ZIX2_ARUDO